MEERRDSGDAEVGARLRQVRREAGLSLERLAERLGVSHTTVSRIELGRRSTTIQMVHAWYRACGYELDAVAVGSPEQATSLAVAMAALPEGEVGSVIRVVEAWPRLTERARGRILGIVDSTEP